MGVHLVTAQADDAHAAATSDRQAQADLVLNLAIIDAIDLIREGRPGFAEFRLTRALISANRILGRAS